MREKVQRLKGEHNYRSKSRIVINEWIKVGNRVFFGKRAYILSAISPPSRDCDYYIF